jgi:hypothetical protein
MRLLFEGIVRRGWQVVFRGGKRSKPMPKLVAATYAYYLDGVRGVCGPRDYLSRNDAVTYLLDYYGVTY